MASSSPSMKWRGNSPTESDGPQLWGEIRDDSMGVLQRKVADLGAQLATLEQRPMASEAERVSLEERQAVAEVKLEASAAREVMLTEHVCRQSSWADEALAEWMRLCRIAESATEHFVAHGCALANRMLQVSHLFEIAMKGGISHGAIVAAAALQAESGRWLDHLIKVLVGIGGLDGEETVRPFWKLGHTIIAECDTDWMIKKALRL